MTKITPNEALNFEGALLELEAIISQMETGNLALEQSIHAYQRGALLLQHCQKSLTDADQQIRVLNDSNTLEAFESDTE